MKNNPIIELPNIHRNSRRQHPRPLGIKFKYNYEEDIYICPDGEKLYKTKHSGEVPLDIL